MLLLNVSNLKFFIDQIRLWIIFYKINVYHRSHFTSLNCALCCALHLSYTRLLRLRCALHLLKLWSQLLTKSIKQTNSNSTHIVHQDWHEFIRGKSKSTRTTSHPSATKFQHYLCTNYYCLKQHPKVKSVV